MPTKPSLKACANPRCPELTVGKYCHNHRAELAVQQDARPSASRRGYGHKWRQASALYLIINPTCVHCGDYATEVDHIIPHKGDMELFWDRGNWQSLCHIDHSRKTGREQAGHGAGRYDTQALDRSDMERR